MRSLATGPAAVQRRANLARAGSSLLWGLPTPSGEVGTAHESWSLHSLTLDINARAGPLLEQHCLILLCQQGPPRPGSRGSQGPGPSWAQSQSSTQSLETHTAPDLNNRGLLPLPPWGRKSFQDRAEALPPPRPAAHGPGGLFQVQ